MPTQTRNRTIGDIDVHPVGLGVMPLAIEGRPEGPAQATRVIHAALDAGVRLIDTADAYSLGGDDVGYGEKIVADALASWSGDADEVLVATKGGHLRPGDGSWTVDGRPEYLKQACEASLKRLGVDAIGLYQFHRTDPDTPYAESIGALKELLDEGKIRMAGISNASVDQINEARGIVEIVSVQNQFSPAFRSSQAELELCEELGLAFLPWSPLGGISSASELGEKHAAFKELADKHGVSPQRLTLAWMLARSPVAVPIPGSSRPETIRDSVAAAELELTADEVAQLDAA